MRLDVLQRICGEELLFSFSAAGFEAREAVEGGAAASLVWRVGAKEELAKAVYEVQRAADLCIDPASVSFAQVSDMVQNGRTLPGIEDVNDKVVEPKAAKASDRDRPKKPWEK